MVPRHFAGACGSLFFPQSRNLPDLLSDCRYTPSLVIRIQLGVSTFMGVPFMTSIFFS